LAEGMGAFADAHAHKALGLSLGQHSQKSIHLLNTFTRESRFFIFFISYKVTMHLL
jgi:hypothetical protein